MSNKKYDLAIAYRIYPKVAKVPPIYPEDKYKLSELCLRSFYNAVKKFNPYIYIILDGCPPEYKSLFEEILEDIDYEFIETDAIGNGATFGLQMDLLLEQNKSEIVYFAEDDYFYFENVFDEMLKAAENDRIDFISPYDHPDTHKIELHNYKKEKIKTENIDWLKCASTTMTFMTTKSVLKSTEKVLRTYSKGNLDASLWITLTKLNAFNISLIAKSFLKNTGYSRIYLKMYFYNFLETLFGKKFTLVQPVPTLSAHMENKHLPEGFDWDEEFAKLK